MNGNGNAHSKAFFDFKSGLLFRMLFNEVEHPYMESKYDCLCQTQSYTL